MKIDETKGKLKIIEYTFTEKDIGLCILSFPQLESTTKNKLDEIFDPPI